MHEALWTSYGPSVTALLLLMCHRPRCKSMIWELSLSTASPLQGKLHACKSLQKWPTYSRQKDVRCVQEVVIWGDVSSGCYVCARQCRVSECGCMRVVMCVCVCVC